MALDVEITGFRKFVRNTLRGFVSVRIVDLDLQIIDCTLHERDGKRWIGLPGKPQIGTDNKAIVDANGKLQYATVLKFVSRLSSDAFQSAVLLALDQDRRTAA